MTTSQEIWNESRARKRDQAPSIVGLAPSPCRCGSRLATIATDHVLKCECGARRGLLSSRTADFIKQIVGTFGIPDVPSSSGEALSNQFASSMRIYPELIRHRKENANE